MGPVEPVIRRGWAAVRRVPRDVWLAVAIFAAASAVALVTVLYVVLPAWRWMVAHPTLTLFALISGFLAVSAAYSLRRDRVKREAARRAERERAEAEARQFALLKEVEERERARKAELGLVEYVQPGGLPVWVTPEEVATLRELERTRQLHFDRRHLVLEVVQRFHPAMWYDSELPYQAELAGWLKAHFPETEVEVQRGRSRVDLLVRDTAIEVKGPTRMADLQTLADKCARYSQHFPHLLIVLFRIEVHDAMYAEWERGIRSAFPHVIILRRDPPPTLSRRPAAPAGFHPATCTSCRTATSVPFEPEAGRPVYCSDCYYRRRPSGQA